MTYKGMRNIVLFLAVFLPFELGTNFLYEESPFGNEEIEEKQGDTAELVSETQNVILMDLKEDYCDTKCFLSKNSDIVRFLGNTFGVSEKMIVDDLIDINKSDVYDEFNIGRLTNSTGDLKKFNSFERGLVEYLFVFVKNNPTAVDNSYKPYNGGALYVERLIKYFTQIYDNVDYLTAVSIGAAESGYYQVKYMLNYNNVFGGMGSNGLIKYKNIEYGILSYIRLLSNNYYGNGLTTKESIGRVYCPTYIDGVKVASPHWLDLVGKAMNHYRDSEETISVANLID